MNSKKGKRKNLLVVLILLLIGVSIGYALLTSTLNISGTSNIKKLGWDVHFDNIVLEDGNVTAIKNATIDDNNKTSIEYIVKLNKPGDKYEFTVDVVNAGDIDAMIGTVSKTGLTEEQAKYMDYNVSYLIDGKEKELSEKDLLSKNSSKKIKVSVKYKTDLNSEDLPIEDKNVTLKLEVNYIQADNSAKEVKFTICKAATSLHTEECTQTSESSYCSSLGYTESGSKKTTTITYGNISSNGTLKSGDAFDCDVDGDGIYDSSKERFYYVTDLDTDNNYAVLISANNFSEGVVGDKNTQYTRSGNNSYGPNFAVLDLPKTNQWKNVTLSNDVRNIKDETGTVKVENFSYQGYAARFITFHEVAKACNISITAANRLDNCIYLLENTDFSNSSNQALSFWTESTSAANNGSVWSVYGSNGIFSGIIISDGAVRPAIEVLKSNMSY